MSSRIGFGVLLVKGIVGGDECSIAKITVVFFGLVASQRVHKSVSVFITGVTIDGVNVIKRAFGNEELTSILDDQRGALDSVGNGTLFGSGTTP